MNSFWWEGLFGALKVAYPCSIVSFCSRSKLTKKSQSGGNGKNAVKMKIKKLKYQFPLEVCKCLEKEEGVNIFSGAKFSLDGLSI